MCLCVCVFSSHLCAFCYCSFLLFIFVLFCLVLMLSSELCRCSSDLFLGSCPADHVLNWQLLILLGIVEARSVNVKNTTTTTTTTTWNLLTLGREFEYRCCHTNWDFFYKIINKNKNKAQQLRTIESLVHKIRLHGRRGKGTAKSLSREKRRLAPQKEGGEILFGLPPV